MAPQANGLLKERAIPAVQLPSYLAGLFRMQVVPPFKGGMRYMGSRLGQTGSQAVKFGIAQA